MTIAVELQPISGAPPAVHYRWDADTDIFTATLAPAGQIAGPSASVEIEGSDGSWLVLDLRDRRLVGVEIALWPDVHHNAGLAAPRAIESADVVVPLPGSQASATLEVEAPVRAESDAEERLVYFRIGERREARSVRFGADVLLDVDRKGRLAGLWLLNVPPFPAPTPP